MGWYQEFVVLLSVLWHNSVVHCWMLLLCGNWLRLCQALILVMLVDVQPNFQVLDHSFPSGSLPNKTWQS